MEEKVVSNAQLKALKDFVAPKSWGRKLNPPSVEDRLKYLRNNSDIPIDDKNKKLIMEIMKGGLKDYEAGELERKISLLDKERLVQGFLESSPNVDERIEFVIKNQLTGGAIGEQTFHLMRQDLTETQLDEFIEKLVMKEMERAEKVQKSTNLREHSIYSTAIKFAVGKVNNMESLAKKYVQNVHDCVKEFKVPNSLLSAAEKMSPANTIFSLISGPIQNEANRKWENAKKETNSSNIQSLESNYRAIANTSNKLGKTVKSSNDPTNQEDREVKSFLDLVETLQSKIKESVHSKTVSNDEVPITRQRSGAVIGVHRDPSIDALSKSDTQVSKRGSKRLARQFSKEEIEADHKKQKTEEPAKKQDETEHATSEDLEKLRTQIAEVKAKAKALLTKVAETRQDYQTLKNITEVKKLNREISKLEVRSEARKEASKARLDEIRGKIAEHRETTRLPPQAQDMMNHSKVQAAKAEKEAAKKANTDTTSKPVSPRGSRSE